MKTYYYTVAIGNKFEKLADILVASGKKVGMDIDIYSPEYDPSQRVWESRMAKINGFRNRPSGYDRACFIDADCLVLKNFDRILLNGARIEDWSHRERKYAPKGIEKEERKRYIEKLNSTLDKMNLTEMRMDKVGKSCAEENGIEYCGDFEWNGGFISGSIEFLDELMDEWERWHTIINDVYDGTFIRDQIAFKYTYYLIGYKKWGYRSIAKEFNWTTKMWGLNKDAYVLHECGYVKKHKDGWGELVKSILETV